MNTSVLAAAVTRSWDASIVPQLVEYIRIPAKSPHFDPQWEKNGHIEKVIRLGEAWARQQPVRGMTVEIVRLPGRTPVLYFDVPGAGGRTVLLYGHLDKQPEMTGWRDGLGPWLPVIEDGKLYGRGGADDGYALFASLAAIGALQAQGLAHARCVGLIETCEESGSYDLPAYLDLLAPRMGAVDFVVGLDSGCGDYERLWATTSLRGLAGGALRRRRPDRGRAFGRRERHRSIVVSRGASGSRPVGGREDRPRAACAIPCADSRRARAAGEAGRGHHGRDHGPKISVCGGDTQPMIADHAEALLDRTWRPALSVTGADGLPAIAHAGNVLRPRTSLKLSLRRAAPWTGQARCGH